MTLYCICRTSDSTGFMIQCENCLEWFHARCLKQKKKELERYIRYYCQPCIASNPKSLFNLIKEEKPDTKPNIKDLEPNIKLEKRINNEVEFNQNTSVNNSQQQQQPLTQTTTQEKASRKIITEKRTINVDNTSKPKQQYPKQTALEPKCRQRTKISRKSKKQCEHMDCVKEARQESKYCSDECGYEMNKKRYIKHFVPKWKYLNDNRSKGYDKRLEDYETLNNDKKKWEDTIDELKKERVYLIENISIIKKEAKKMYDLSTAVKNEKDDDDEMEMDDNDETEAISDLVRPFCFTCGSSIPPQQCLKHWTSCHKKAESTYLNTADQVIQYRTDNDSEPQQLFCQAVDKKTKRFCLNLESFCPQHNNWTIEKDEVCACPAKIMQKLVPDGNYCLELKKDCTLHYHWDKFRLAQNNVQRLHAFQTLEYIKDRLNMIVTQLNNSYGGCFGMMLHKTTELNNSGL